MANFNLNKVVLGGRLTADPELKKTQAGDSVVSFILAVSRRYVKEGAQQTADFINCVAWQKTAEFICSYFRKGSSLAVTGEIQTRSWTDAQNCKHYATDVRVDEAFFVDSKSEAQPGAYAGAAPAAQPAAPAAAPAPAAPSYTGAPNFEVLEDDEQLPF